MIILAAPATLTLLYAKTLPKDGGDTEFINCYDVLDALPAAMRSRVANLRTVLSIWPPQCVWSLNGPRKKKRDAGGRPSDDPHASAERPPGVHQSQSYQPDRWMERCRAMPSWMSSMNSRSSRNFSTATNGAMGSRRLGQPLHDAPR